MQLWLYYCMNLDITAELGGRTIREQYKDQDNWRHFIMRQDLRNITRKLQDFAHHHHSEDATSGDRIFWKLSEKDPSPVLFYKPQNSKKANYPCVQEESFFFIL